MIKLTDNAQQQAIRLIEQKNDASYFLRIGVRGGGCSGMSYEVELDKTKNEWDKEFNAGPVRVVCDQKSFVYLNGMEVDYSNSLVGGGFRFSNPNATGSCGCGTSFSV